MSLLSQMIAGDPGMYEPVRFTFDLLITEIITVPEMLVKAELRRALDSDTRVAVRRRWMKIKDMCNFMDAKELVAKDKVIPSW